MVNEGQDSLAPQSKRGGWRAVKYILANDTFEKVATVSLISNLVMYLHTQYNMDPTTSAQVFNVWNGCANFVPLFGAFLADAYVGKFRMLIIGSLVSVLAMGVITATADVPSLRPPSCPSHSNCTNATAKQQTIVFVGLGLFAIGSGFLRPFYIAFGADQFDIKTEKGKTQLETFCEKWYLLFTVAFFVALTIVVYIQTNVSWIAGFIIPTVCFALSLTIFLFGQKTYVKLKPKGSIISDMVKVPIAAFRKRNVDVDNDSTLSFYDPPASEGTTKLPRTIGFKWVDKAAVITDPSELDNNGKPINSWRLCSVQRVEELKLILSILPAWESGVICLLAMGQTSTYGILQAFQSDRKIGSSFSVPPALLGLVPMIPFCTSIFLRERGSWTRKTTDKGKMLSSIERRMRDAIIISCVTMFISGRTEERRRRGALEAGTFESPKSVWWLVPPFFASGWIGCYMAIPLMELLTSQLPENMKTMGGGMFFLSLGAASYMNTGVIRFIRRFSRMTGGKSWLDGNDLNSYRLDYYYYVLGGIEAVNLLFFLFFARRYLHQEVDQKPSTNEPEDVENRNRHHQSAAA